MLVTGLIEAVYRPHKVFGLTRYGLYTPLSLCMIGFFDCVPLVAYLKFEAFVTHVCPMEII